MTTYQINDIVNVTIPHYGTNKGTIINIRIGPRGGRQYDIKLLKPIIDMQTRIAVTGFLQVLPTRIKPCHY